MNLWHPDEIRLIRAFQNLNFAHFVRSKCRASAGADVAATPRRTRSSRGTSAYLPDDITISKK